MTRFRTYRHFVLLGILGLWLVTNTESVADNSFAAQVSVYFSPHGGCTEAIVHELETARKQVLMQAYSFTSAPIAKALVEAKKRGVEVKAVLDKSNETAQYSSATFLANADIPVLIDNQHAIAHNKIMIIDRATVLTGSFNFTKAAEEKNAENLVILKGSPELARRYTQNFDQHVAHSHPYQREASSSSPHRSGGKQEESAMPPGSVYQETNRGQIQANRESKIYHLPSCPGYARVGEKNAVLFSTEAEARKAGYRKAKNCP